MVNFPFAIKRILGIKRIFPCSFANKRMRLLTRVYGITVKKFEFYPKAFMSHTVTLDCFHKLAELLVMVDSINKLPDSKFLNGQLSMTFLQAQ